MFEVYHLVAVVLFLVSVYIFLQSFRSRGVIRPLCVLVAVALCVAALLGAHVVAVPFLSLAVK
jgi:hypothetical protein